MKSFYTKKEKKKKKKIDRIIKDIIITDIWTLFEQEDDDDFKQKRGSNFWNNNCIEYESNGGINKKLLLDKYLNKIKTYLRDKIIDLENSETWKIQLKTAINFISSQDVGQCFVHSKSDNIKLTSYNDANEVLDELFDSFRSRYKDNL